MLANDQIFILAPAHFSHILQFHRPGRDGFEMRGRIRPELSMPEDCRQRLRNDGDRQFSDTEGPARRYGIQ